MKAKLYLHNRTHRPQNGINDTGENSSSFTSLLHSSLRLLMLDIHRIEGF